MNSGFRLVLHSGLVALMFFVPASASAGFIVSIGNVALSTGGPSGLVDVNVEWQDPDPGGVGSISSVNIDYFFARFQIVPVGAVTSSVAFRPFIADPGPPALFDNGNLEQSDGNYLFAGNSVNISLAQSSGKLDGVVNTEFIGGDGRADFDPMNAPANLVTLMAAPKLLYRFELLATGTATGTEQFQLAIDPSPTTQFFDNDGNEIAFSSISGTITVTQGAAAVPEPATGLTLLLGTGILAWHTRKRRLRIERPDTAVPGRRHKAR